MYDALTLYLTPLLQICLLLAFYTALSPIGVTQTSLQAYIEQPFFLSLWQRLLHSSTQGKSVMVIWAFFLNWKPNGRDKMPTRISANSPGMYVCMCVHMFCVCLWMPDIPVGCLPHSVPGFFQNVEDLNSGPCACLASSSYSEPSPQVLSFVFVGLLV